jgi:toxin ParE1/3/4
LIGKSIYLSQVARKDLQDALLSYELQNSELAVDGCLDALGKAYQQISKFPKSGSTRTGSEVNLPGLRSWPLTRYPFLLFYKEEIDQIDCWRLLHEKRDISSYF